HPRPPTRPQPRACRSDRGGARGDCRPPPPRSAGAEEEVNPPTRGGRVVPLMVLFDRAGDGATDPDARCFGLGPYLLAAIEGDVLVAFEGACPVRLAVRVAGGWAGARPCRVTLP